MNNIQVSDLDREHIGRLYAEWQLAKEKAGGAERMFQGTLSSLKERLGIKGDYRYDLNRGLFLTDEGGENG